MHTDSGAPRVLRALLAWLFVSALGGCDVASDEARSRPVLLTVNGQEITAGTLEQAIATREGNFSPEGAKSALEDLINEELLVQDAVASGLDRDPAVAASQALASRQTLARLAAERVLGRAPPVNAASVKEYYTANPALFAQRRIYQFVVFAMPKASLAKALQRQLDSAHSVERVRSALDRYAVKYEVHPVTAAAENLPATKLKEFARARVGDLLLVEHEDEVFLMSVGSVTEAPIDFESARPAIEQQLADRQKREVLARYFSERRARAAISYHEDALTSWLAPRGHSSEPATDVEVLESLFPLSASNQ